MGAIAYPLYFLCFLCTTRSWRVDAVPLTAVFTLTVLYESLSMPLGNNVSTNQLVQVIDEVAEGMKYITWVHVNITHAFVE